MRSWAILLSLLLLPLVPVGQAQTEAASILEDGAGDVAAGSQGQFIGVPEARYPHLDLVALHVQEMETDIQFELEVADIDPIYDLFIADDASYYVTFDHNDQRFAIQMFRIRADQYYVWGNLYQFDPDGSNFDFVRNLNVEMDPDAEMLRVLVAREDLTDNNGAAPFPGRSLDDFFAFAHLRTSEGLANINNIVVGPQWDAADIMPDSGQPEGELPIQLGLVQSGTARLGASSPMRASNGEASTFVMSVNAANDGPAATFAMEVIGAPSSWEVVVPDAFLTLDEGEAVDIPVLITTPFTHQHGAVETFRLEMQNLDDPSSVGRIELGIRYHEVPQPAGHHSHLWVHTQRYGDDTPLFPITDNAFSGNGGFTYINTLEDDEQDQQVPVKGNYWGYGYQNGFTGPESGAPVSTWRWFLYLQPGLEMGLDFDLDDTGNLVLPFRSALPLPQAQAFGNLMHVSFDEETETWTRLPVAELTPTAPIDMLANQEHVLSWDFQIAEEADRLPFTKRAFFGIEVNLTSPRFSAFTGVEAPELVPGGEMELPLFEYRDEVSDLFQTVGQVMFHAVGPQERMANPGDRILLEVELANHRDVATEFDLRLEGVNQQWATTLESAPRLAADQMETIRIAIDVPADARDGDVADIVLTAEAVDEPTVRALVRLVVEADTDAEHADDAEAIAQLSGPVEEAPSIAPIALLGLLAVAFRIRRPGHNG